MNFSSTPWGAVQHQRQLAPGIVEISTASHGGIFVRDDLLERIDPEWREWSQPWSGSRNWFEEDCAACAVILAFPHLFSEHAVECSIRTAEGYGLPADPKGSPKPAPAAASQLALI